MVPGSGLQACRVSGPLAAMLLDGIPEYSPSQHRMLSMVASLKQLYSLLDCPQVAHKVKPKGFNVSSNEKGSLGFVF